MPNAMVFPGGVVAGPDLDPAWLQLYTEAGYTGQDMEQLVLAGVDR